MRKLNGFNFKKLLKVVLRVVVKCLFLMKRFVVVTRYTFLVSVKCEWSEWSEWKAQGECKTGFASFAKKKCASSGKTVCLSPYSRVGLAHKCLMSVEPLLEPGLAE